MNLLPAKFSSHLPEFIQVPLLMPEPGQVLFKWILKKAKSRVAFSWISGFEGGEYLRDSNFSLLNLNKIIKKKNEVNPKARMQMEFQPAERSRGRATSPRATARREHEIPEPI